MVALSYDASERSSGYICIYIYKIIIPIKYTGQYIYYSYREGEREREERKIYQIERNR